MTFIFSSNLRYFLMATICLLTVSCGGGGGSSNGGINDTPPPPPPPTLEVGIDIRPSNATCLAPERTIVGGSLGIVEAFPNLPSMTDPVQLIHAPNENYFYVVEVEGTVQRFLNDPSTATLNAYLSVNVDRVGEGGLLSIAFDPDWPTTPHIYVSYTITAADGTFRSRLSRLIVADDSTLPATYEEQVLLELEQPTAVHNGGNIAFGPDGSIYLGLGDGGTDFTSQQTNNWLGSMLRIDVRGVGYPNPGYEIPVDNPFATNPRCHTGENAQSCPEIYAWGFRNPWRWSFDLPSGDLWVGDVGEGDREEVDIVELGSNYGWRCREGTLDYNTTGCDLGALTDPVYEYPNPGQAAISGGYVYRGSRVPELRGHYIFADFLGTVSYLTGDANIGYTAVPIGDGGLVAGFGIDRQGEVYIPNYFGRVLRFDSNGGTVQDNVPDNLADTGCASSTDLTAPASGLIPYGPAAPFWSDGADKDRWLALPNGANIDVSASGDFAFPSGSVLMKNFSVANRLVETRLFMRHPDGDWAGYTYQWNASETTATRVRQGATVNVDGQDWLIPSEAECLICHTSAAGYSLGLETAQLNGDFPYPVSGITDNQLEVFNHIDVFSVDVLEPVSSLPALVNPFDAAADIDDRARAYLHTNCAGCHRPGGTTGVSLDLRFDTALSQTQMCDVIPESGSLGIANARLIAPAEPDRSVLLNRINRRDGFAMPPLASNIIDDQGVALIRDWITQIGTCP